MDLNRETAMRLWNKAFGKETKVSDFAGREMAKGAYNDRNSKYGWNVDHIQPTSRGGKTADHNLVCCNIDTNDEKGDKFPCFTANGRNFQIIKVQNHYEIQEHKSYVSESQEEKEESEETEVNFYDSAAGIRLYKQLKGIQNKMPFVGSVLIYLDNVTNTALYDFIEELFSEENIYYKAEQPKYWTLGAADRGISTKILVRNYNLALKEDVADLLDKCVLLNTYLSSYFVGTCLTGFLIAYRLDAFKEKKEMYNEPSFPQSFSSLQTGKLYINELVRLNTDAKNKVAPSNSDFIAYNYVFPKLEKNLQKEVNGK